MGRIRLLIIDEHAGVRRVLARRLSEVSDFDVVGATGDADEGLLQIRALAPDLVLLDTKMSKADGLEVCRIASSLSGATKVAVLTSYGDVEELRRVSLAGARGYLLKDVNTQELADNIRRLAGLPPEGSLVTSKVMGTGSSWKVKYPESVQ